MNATARRLRVPAVSLLMLVSLLASMAQHTPVIDAEQGVARQAESRVHLPIILAGGPQASSLELISQALEDGAITIDQALTYQVYVVYADRRLPKQFRGTDSGLHASDVIGDVVTQFETLKPETQQLIAPFLVQPSYHGSWVSPADITALTTVEQGSISMPCYQQTGRYTSTPTTNGKVRVWWPTADAKAAAMAAAVVSDVDTDIWPRVVTGLMRREPLSDSLRACNGGDGLLDIYVHSLGPVAPGNFKAGIRGITVEHVVGGCKAMPAWIQINSNLPANERRITLAHELMHAIQWSYGVSAPCLKPEYDWLMEATAAWVQDYVDTSSGNLEHQFAREYLAKPHVSLEDVSDAMHPYYSYLFLLFLARGYTPDWIRLIWEETASHNSLGAIDAAIGGGLKDRWPEFARRAWNMPPVDQLTRWDKIPVGATAIIKDALPLGEAPLGDTDVPHLAARYYHMTIPDINIRAVTFYNGWTFKLSTQVMRLDSTGPSGTYIAWETVEAAKKKGLKVQILAKINGAWTDPFFMTDAMPYLTLCRDEKQQRLEEIVVIVSNSEWEDRSWVVKPQGMEPRFWTSNVGCYSFAGESERTLSTGGLTESTVADVTWTRTSPGTLVPSGKKTALVSRLYVPSGSVSWQISGSDGGCTYSGTGSGPMGVEGALHVYDFAIAGPASRAYDAGATSQVVANYTVRCPDEPPDRLSKVIGSWIEFEPASPRWKKVQPNGLTIADTAVISQGNPSDSYKWTFISQPEK